MIHDKQTYTIGGFQAFNPAMSEHAKYDIMVEARNRVICSVHSQEDDALRRAVCRYFGVSDPFDAASRVQCIVTLKGARRYVEQGTMVDIIRFFPASYEYDDGKVTYSIGYKTFDGIK